MNILLVSGFSSIRTHFVHATDSHGFGLVLNNQYFLVAVLREILFLPTYHVSCKTDMFHITFFVLFHFVCGNCAMIVQGVSSYQTRDESLPGFLNFLVL
jgi:hypothetical protein